MESLKLANNEKVEDVEIDEYVGPSEESSVLAGKAIERLALKRQREFDARLQSVKSKTKDMNVDEMLALLENGGYRTMKDGGMEALQVSQKPQILWSLVWHI